MSDIDNDQVTQTQPDLPAYAEEKDYDAAPEPQGVETSTPQPDPGQTPADAPQGEKPEWLTDDLQSAAEQYGVDPSQYRDQDALRQAMVERDLYAAQQAQAYYQQYQQPQQQYPPQQQQGPPQQAAPQQPAPPQFTPYELELDGDDYGKELVEKLGGLNEHYANQINQLNGAVRQALQQFGSTVGQQMQQYENMQRQQVFERTLQQIDQSVGQLDASFQPVVANPQNRQQLQNQVLQILDGYAMSGYQPPSLGAVVNNAAHMLFSGQRQQQQAPSPQRTPQSMARPNNQAVTPNQIPDPRLRAIQKARQWFDEKGLGHSDFVTDDHGGV